MKVLSTLVVVLCAIPCLSAQEITFTTVCDTTEFCTSQNNCGPVAVNLFADATTTCNTGNVEMTYTIDLNDDGIMDINGTGNIIDDTYDLGNHRVVFTATDDCGNEEDCGYLFLVKDCIPPIAVADTFLIGELGVNGGFELFANQVDDGSFDNCGIASMLIVSPSFGAGQVEPPPNALESWSFSCCSDEGVNTIDFWVSDEFGNWSYETTFIVIQDNIAPFCQCIPNIVCPESQTEDGHNIDDVVYHVVWGNLNYDLNSGECSEMPNNEIVTVTPERNSPYLDGVTTFDLILISRHILGIDTLDSPYKIIASDVNNSGSITTIDLLEIRKLLLGVTDAFPNNNPWRFVDIDYVFPNPENPWQEIFPEWVYVENEYYYDVVLTGLKVGDVNQSFDPGLIPEEESDQRGSFDLNILDQPFEKGELITVDFYSNQMADYTGFQFSLDYSCDILKFENFKKGSLKYLDENNIGVNENAGTISVSWVNMDFDILQKTEGGLFSFQFRALNNGTLKDVLKQSDTRLASEIYTHGLNTLDLTIQILEAASQISKEVVSFPNPFHKKVSIQFDLPQDDEVELKILDVKGKIIKIIKAPFVKGRNEVNLSEDLFPSSGIYFYQIEGSSISVRNKIIKM